MNTAVVGLMTMYVDPRSPLPAMMLSIALLKSLSTFASELPALTIGVTPLVMDAGVDESPLFAGSSNALSSARMTTRV